MDRCSVYIQVKFTKISTFGLYVLIQGSVWTYFTVYILGKNFKLVDNLRGFEKILSIKKKKDMSLNIAEVKVIVNLKTLQLSKIGSEV